MTHKLSLKKLPVKDKKVLMRVDFNVPLDKNATITDDTRIQAALPSIRHVLQQGGALILMSHLGRPKDQKVPSLSLAPCAKRLAELLHQPVTIAPDCVGQEVEALVRNLKPGQVLLLENLRFHRGEEHPDEDPEFVKRLAKLGDVYVNDAFGTAHRAHASTATLTQYFPGRAAAGFLLEKEIQFLGSALQNPRRPFYSLIGGAKISTKIGILKALIDKVDGLLVGGGMAYTFYKSLGWKIGDSICEDQALNEARAIMEECRRKNVLFQLPVDNVIANKPVNGAQTQIVETQQGIPEHFLGVDIGPKTIALFTKQLQQAATVFWNGPLGIFEHSDFAKGTQAIAKVVAALDATTIVGGGDSVAALQALGLGDKITHVSTGGGATLEYIELGTLPGIEALSDES